jgi:16S rRNA (uracil1498-N3)-methyltransferase
MKETMRTNTIRLFVEQSLEAGCDVACSRTHANYLLNVMRLSNDDELLVFNGQNGEWRAVLSRVKRNDCALNILDQVRPQEEGPDIQYLFAPVKRARLDFMVQKATELGVASLQPVLTRRTEARRVKLERMRANVIEAAEQCGVLRVPQILETISLDKLLDDWDSTRRIIYCDEEAPISSPLDALQALVSGPLAVLIGPEGGFDEGERTRLAGLSCVTSISLGPRIMRADTAGVAALSLVNAVLGDWR